MITKNKISGRVVYTSNTKNVVGDGGSGSSIPVNVTAMQGQIIGPPLGSIEIVAGDCLYLKVERAEVGDGVISGPVSIAGDAVSVSDGVNTASVSVSGFDTVSSGKIFVLETISDGVRNFFRVGSV